LNNIACHLSGGQAIPVENNQLCPNRHEAILQAGITANAPKAINPAYGKPKPVSSFILITASSKRKNGLKTSLVRLLG